MKRNPLFTIGITAIAVCGLAACSGSPATNSALPASSGSGALMRGHYNLAGNDTRYLAGPQSRIMRTLLATPAKKSKVEKDFFIANLEPYVLIYSNKNYSEVGELTSGISIPDGVWVDAKGNVYVANVSTNVVEFKKGAGSPICTYTGATDPINVTTDSKGNVYVVDFGSGDVDEYAQCTNTIEKQFEASGVEGAAVDKSGDVFVSYDGNLEEFKGGSTSGTPLGASVGESAGLIIDKNGNLIADDQAGDILTIAPPYSSATVLVSGLSDPFHCSLNKAENLLFNANDGTPDVTVYSYPSGKLVQTVSGGGGEGVGESPDAVF
jgi:hypothetical protein